VDAGDTGNDSGDVFPKVIYPLLPEVGDRLFLADDQVKKATRPAIIAATITPTASDISSPL
jgi:hypothetical protein